MCDGLLRQIIESFVRLATHDPNLFLQPAVKKLKRLFRK
jgi:hypothetical protein